MQQCDCHDCECYCQQLETVLTALGDVGALKHTCAGIWFQGSVDLFPVCLVIEFTGHILRIRPLQKH